MQGRNFRQAHEVRQKKGTRWHPTTDTKHFYELKEEITRYTNLEGGFPLSRSAETAEEKTPLFLLQRYNFFPTYANFKALFFKVLRIFFVAPENHSRRPLADLATATATATATAMPRQRQRQRQRQCGHAR